MSLSVFELQPRRPVMNDDEYLDDEITYDISQEQITHHIGYAFQSTSRVRRDLVNVARQLKICADLKESFFEVFDVWELCRKKSINYLDTAIRELDNIHFNTNIAKTTASVGGIISGCIGLAASIAMLSNKDASSMRLAAGIGNLVSCGVNAGAAASEFCLSKKYMDKAKEILQKDNECIKPIQEWFERSEDLKSAIEEVCNCDMILDIFQKLSIVVPLVIQTCDSLLSQVDEVVNQVVKMFRKNISHSDIEKIILICASICRNPQLLKVMGDIHAMIKESPSIMPVTAMLVKVPCELKFLVRHTRKSSRNSSNKGSRSEAIAYGLFQGVNIAIDLFSLHLLVEDFQKGSKSEQSAVLKELKQQLEMELKLVSQVRQKLAKN